MLQGVLYLQVRDKTCKLVSQCENNSNFTLWADGLLFRWFILKTSTNCSFKV